MYRWIVEAPMGTHEISLFGGDENLTLTDLGIAIEGSHLQLTADGDLNILGEKFYIYWFKDRNRRHLRAWQRRGKSCG
ncbi:hypothetical protein [Rhodohalobacter sp.]|uniref:hypothetical protein n=1 Tax=Rhodohalobacter sp. TaxID=1974210 RepID=UPI002ACD56CA|nr:hypothetical protein [Rhodohalobacter sp.]MDZ7757739.1 hypothetical protein [Rhodohalobacter sp.]